MSLKNFFTRTFRVDAGEADDAATLYLTNVRDVDITDVTVVLNLPDGLALDDNAQPIALEGTEVEQAPVEQAAGEVSETVDEVVHNEPVADESVKTYSQSRELTFATLAAGEKIELGHVVVIADDQSGVTREYSVSVECVGTVDGAEDREKLSVSVQV